MHLNAKRPVFVPAEYCAEIEKLSKAALMDLAWDMAEQLTHAAEGNPNATEVMATLRERAALIVHYRKARA